ncbi:MAG TPA: hypothetical protein VJN43_17580 [Bryobacteraceae bacterium]|nr:hypothetical protein [Bryobacteraceae bacterium]
MTAFFIAALIPWLYWDQGPKTVNEVKQAGVERVYVPAGQVGAWKAAGIDTRAFEAKNFIKLPVPGVRYRMDVASATTMPWIDANGWRIECGAGKGGHATYYYETPRGKAVLAAAEAYAWDAEAVVHPDSQDLDAFGRMLAFLRSIDQPRLPQLANIGVVDDGSARTGEVLNLLARRNLLLRVVNKPDPKLDLNVQIGSKDYPESEAANPAAFANLVRRKLGDDKRLARIYGSEVVLIHLNGDGTKLRVHLVNYSGRKVEGLRVRVLGEYPHHNLAAFEIGNAALTDYLVSSGATEFTVPEMDAYAAVDLTK